ncbi:MAG: diol dehydratase reactivase subunit alpha [Tepidanaerobacter acetatoxydans]|uniref:diol dehydratase reactivase subunit alpha n=1 Tax=Tepidanaerobacter acetatoxydans TaxID=499229 RepID=UPI0026F2C808|nr:diol dehydratase reactivase subunit alpha [Tepidanaerobacter acetatoxydans]NLU11464.1 diol dehydratase reactivase subunit alpha [Tepidanaerobacter acetatoxydans]
MLVAGVDIGNNTTEVAIARIEGEKISFVASGLSTTTGIKGTPANIIGVRLALENTLRNSSIGIKDLDLIRLNEATPVISDMAMEAITETIITESTMIGHNPSTPGGIGLGVGTTTLIFNLKETKPGEQVIVIIPQNVDFEDAAHIINEALNRGAKIEGAIVQKDDGVLIANRLEKKIPIVDEVTLIEKVPVGMLAAVEVAEQGYTIKTLSNPYGIATVFNLTPEETKNIVPVARALIGNRSAVVIRTPAGDVEERRIPAGELILKGKKGKIAVNLDEGAEKVMQALEQVYPLLDAEGTPGTNVGGLLANIRNSMAEVTGQKPEDVKIQDILAVDTLVQQKVKGGLANEFFSEDAIGMAAMVKSSRLPMEKVAQKIKEELGIPVYIAGVEADMAINGAMTTPGTAKPLAVLDLGGGSVDAAFLSKDNEVKTAHMAGAGDMVNMLIGAELGISDKTILEDIKCNPLAKVESLFSIRMEDGTVKFFESPLDPNIFAKVVLLKKEGMIPLPGDMKLEKIRIARREAKKKVFITNALRALKQVAPAGNIRLMDFVVLLGGSALDFEIPELISDALANYGVVAGRGNIRGTEGPRNAVATGLVLSGRDVS